MNPEIINYIQQQLDRGVQPQALRNYMLQYYPQNVIDEHLNYVIQTHNQTFAQQRVPYQQPTQQAPLQQQTQQQFSSQQTPQSYPSQQAQQGVPQQAPQQGYPQYPSQPAPQTVTHEIRIPAKTWLFALMVVTAAGLIFLGIQSLNGAKVPKQLDLTLEPITSAAYPGEDVKFQVSVFNMGKTAGYDVHVVYSLLMPTKDTVLVSKSESLALQTRLEVPRTLKVPANAPPGAYRVKANVSYGQYSAESMFTFDVLAKGQTTPPAKNTTRNETLPVEPPKPAANQSQQDNTEEPPFIPPVQPPKSDNPFAGLAPWDLERKVRAAASDPDSAARNCDKLVDSRDYCFSKLAFYSNTTGYCDQSQDASVKDRCLTSMIMLGNYDPALCEKIVDPTFKQSCSVLVQSQRLAQQQEQPTQ